jgi:hypothetical protein
LSARNFSKKFHQKTANKREQEAGREAQEVGRQRVGLAIGKLAGGAVLLMLIGLLSVPGAASAEEPGSANMKPCGSIVKKLGWEPVFYKARVLITSGNVLCAEARQIIWKSLKPGGFNGGLNNWQCESKGAYDPYIEKCEQEDPRRVIKSSKPKRCDSCSRNLKRKQLSELLRKSNAWKLCGTFHLTRGTDVNLEAKHYSCLQSLEVVAQMIVDPGLLECGDGCEAKGFKCHSPGAIQGGIGGAGNGFICVKGSARVRLKGVIKRGAQRTSLHH